MTWWWLSTLFGMWWKRLFHVSVVQLLSVHVRMRSHRASLDRSIHSQRQMPRIKSIFALHRHYKRPQGEGRTLCGTCMYSARENGSQQALVPQHFELNVFNKISRRKCTGATGGSKQKKRMRCCLLTTRKPINKHPTNRNNVFFSTKS